MCLIYDNNCVECNCYVSIIHLARQSSMWQTHQQITVIFIPSQCGVKMYGTITSYLFCLKRIEIGKKSI